MAKKTIVKKKKPVLKKLTKAKASAKKAVAKKTPAKKRALKKPLRKVARPKRPAKARVNRTVIDAPEALKLAQQIAGAIADKKATDVVILDVRGKASYADYLVVASGDSGPQVEAMADGVAQKLKPEGRRPFSTEGQTSNWYLLDYGEVIAHLFISDVRGFYDLEGLWADAPRVELDAAS